MLLIYKKKNLASISSHCCWNDSKKTHSTQKKNKTNFVDEFKKQTRKKQNKNTQRIDFV